MGVIVKFILKNIKEKKFRTFLILISVALSAALFFASWAISGTIRQMFVERMKQYYGNADIIIHPNEKSPSGYFQDAAASRVRDRLQYAIGALESSATYKYKEETVTFSLKGYDLRELQILNPVSYNEKSNLFPFSGNKIIINSVLAKNYGFKVGESVNLNLAGSKKKFIVAAIANPAGVFQDDGRTNTVVIPKNTLAGFEEARGKVSVLYLKAKNPSDIPALIGDLSACYKRYTVREPFSNAELQQELSMITTPFFIMLLSVLSMSVFIIYTSFKVITRERLPVIGTFRSIGATRLTTDTVLFAESLAYGIIGGLIGCGLGIGILTIMANIMKFSSMKGVKTVVVFSPYQLAVAFVLALFLSFISSLIPIVKTSGISVKELVLNSLDKQMKKRHWKLPLALIMLGAAVVLPFSVRGSVALWVNMGSLLFVIVAIVFLIPYITSAMVGMMGPFFRLIFQNEGELAVKNLRNNKNVLNNISLLAIGISSLLMINILSQSVGIEVLNTWRCAHFDIWMGMGGGDRRTEQVLMAVDGVKNVYGMYGSYSIEVPDYHEKIAWLVGADPNRYGDNWDVGMDGEPRQVLLELEKGRNVLISQSLKEKFNLKAGDYLTLQMKRGKRAYRVAGFFNTLMENGSMAIIPERYFKIDMTERYFNSIFIKTAVDPAVVEKRLKKKFQRQNPFVMTVKAMEKRNMDSNAQIFVILQGFSILALIIGVFGVLNNLLISFLERRRSLAMIRSVGMSGGQLVKMIFAESLAGGVIGGLVGIAGGLLLVFIMPQVLKTVNLPNLTMHYSAVLFINSLLGSVIITVLASVGPAVKSSRLNLIDAIKYE